MTLLTTDNYVVKDELLTILTVCTKDDPSIDKNQESVMDQTSSDYKHILISDESKVDGNEILDAYKSSAKGKYVLLLDSDKVLLDKEMVLNLQGHDEDIVIHGGHVIVKNNIFQKHAGELHWLVNQGHRYTTASI